jgi:hypothetical protein
VEGHLLWTRPTVKALFESRTFPEVSIRRLGPESGLNLTGRLLDMGTRTPVG